MHCLCLCHGGASRCSVPDECAEAHRCPLAHRRDPDRPRRARWQQVVCRDCGADLLRALDRLPALAEAVAARPYAMATRPGIDASTPRLVTVLADWVDHVPPSVAPDRPAVTDRADDDRADTDPADTDPGDPDPAHLAVWLARSLDYICEQPWVAEFASALRRLREDALCALYPPVVRRRPLGPCAEDGCDGDLIPITPPSAHRPLGLVCDTCGIAWHSTAWITLGRAPLARSA